MWYLLWYSLATTIILVAALFGLLQLFLPLVGDYNQDVERYAQQYAGQPIKIMSLDAEWHGFSPSLILNNVRILDKESKETILQISRARLDFDLYEIAKTKQVQFRRFLLSGTDISLVRLPTGEFTLSGFETNQAQQIEQGEGGNAINWILSQGEISLHARNFIFTDQFKQDRRYYYSNLNVRLRNNADRHMIDGSVEFDKESQQEFSFAADIRGDLFGKSSWSGEVYVNGFNMDVARITGPFEFLGRKIQIGKSNFEIWSEWRQASLTGLTGIVSLNNFKISNHGTKQDKNKQDKKQPVAKSVNSQLINFQNINSRFIWDKYQDGWNLQVDRLKIVNNGKSWPESAAAIHYFIDSRNEKRVRVKSSFMRIQDLAPLLVLAPEGDTSYVDYYQQYFPRGDIKDINFEWLESGNRFKLGANIQDVSLRQHGYMPGIEGLAGSVRMTNNNGSFKFDTGNSSFNLPKVFRSEVNLSRVAGTIEWRNTEKAVFLSSRDMDVTSKHFQSQAVLDLEIPYSKKTPFLSVIARFKNVDATKAAIYYPYSIMSEGAIGWLDSAFTSGRIEEGGAIVYGPIDEFPFTRGQGVFDVRFKAKDVTLDYSEGWPRLYKADADVVFRGNSMSVHSNHGMILESEVTNVRAKIPDLKANVLKLDIDGTITGKTQDKLKYLLTAPQLKAKYERALSDLRAGGNSSLDLDMTLSIGKDVDADVKGKLELEDNKLGLVQIPELMDGITGQVSFDNAVLKGRNIAANLLEQPVKVSVRSRKINNQQTAEYKAIGKFNAKRIAKLRFPLLHDMVDGDAPWTVRFQVPEGNDDPKLIVESNLKGVSLNLPVPFKKEKTESRRLKVAAAFRSASKAIMKISYAGNFEGILEKNYTREVWLTRGEVRFGGGPAVLPSTQGLRITGDIEELSYDVWENLIQQLIELNEKENPSPAKPITDSGEQNPYFTLVSSVNLRARNFEIFGQKDSNARIRMDHKQTWLTVNIESKNFSGNITIPEDFDTKPLVLEMNRMNITPDDESGGRIDPRELPPIKLNTRSLNYGNKKLGQVALETSKQVNGMLVQQLIVKPRETIIKGHGKWLVAGDSQKAVLELVIDSKDLGKTMQDLGYVNTIADGVGQVNVSLHWPGSLVEPDLYQIGGKINLSLENGRILDIEPGGAARLLGVFSLQTLPRRLMLDFSDLFSKGLKFDEINGDFNIEQGDAYTSNLKLVGPNADVLLRGRIGLGAQDYDQKVKVTPHITDTTILLSIITSQPILFLFQQLLKQDIEAATSFEYTLSGKWDNYKLTPILKVSPPAPDQPDDF